MIIIVNITQEYYESIKDKQTFGLELLKDDNFIHASLKEQFPLIAPRFQGKDNILALFINTDKLISEVKWEYSNKFQQKFPHIYGEINKDAIDFVININDL